MNVLGVDLAGPAGALNTGVVRFQVIDDRLSFVDELYDGSDQKLLKLAKRLSSEAPLVVGLDAPLSYQPGGGDRARDAELRRAIIKVGMHPGSVMAPTATRMVYLTLRGVTVAAHFRGLNARHSVDVVEVHPGATMGLRGAPLESVKTYKDSTAARIELLGWLGSAGLANLVAPHDCSSHFVSACAAALAAWNWRQRLSAWIVPAEEPWHSYDFSC